MVVDLHPGPSVVFFSTGGFLVTLLTAIDSSSPFRLPLILLGFALVASVAALLIRRTLRDARGSA